MKKEFFTQHFDEASGKFIDYRIKPGELLENIIKEFLNKDYYSEPILDEIKGKMIVNVIKNKREFKTWYEDARYNFDDHAKGVAACEIGYEYFLKKYKSPFGIEEDVIIDRTGHNLGDNLYDVFTKNKKWISEWKSAYSREDVYSRRTEAKETLIKQVRRYIEEGKVKPNELPDYGYAFAIKIDESCIQIVWEKVQIPKS